MPPDQPEKDHPQTGKRRVRRDPRREKTTQAILDAAEDLIGRHGLDGVTYRQIGEAIGSSNRYVVQYHVGDMDEVVRAIFRRRLKQLEERRSELLKESERLRVQRDTRTVLDIIYRPVAEIVDDAGHRVFAAFLTGLLMSDRMALRYDVAPSAPVSTSLFAMLNASIPDRLAKIYPSRSTAVTLMILTCLARRSERSDALEEKRAFEDLLDMATAALLA